MANEFQSQTSRSKKIIWIVIILLLLLIIAALIYLYFAYYKKAETPPQPVVNDTNEFVPPQPVNSLPDLSSFNNPDPAIVADLQGISGQDVNNETEEANASAIARAFAERFGSYSNQGDYKNLDELSSFMTASMNKWAVTYKAQLEEKNPDFNTYYAIETTAISRQVNSFDEKGGKAEILIKTQRQEFKDDNTDPNVFYQDIIIKLVKDGDAWKVDGAYWQ